MTSQRCRGLYALCDEPLAYALTVAAGGREEAPARVRAHLLEALDALVDEGRRRGFARADLQEVRYALIAFIDEQLLEADWEGRAEWMKQPLQLLVYHENGAGERFFTRLRALLEERDRGSAVLAYELCLSLGFHGAYDPRADAEALFRFGRAARRQRAKGGHPAPETLPVPRLVFEPLPPSAWRPVAYAALSSALLALLVVVGLAACVREAREQCLAAIQGAGASEELTP